AFPTVKVTAQVPSTSATTPTITVNENGNPVQGACVTRIGSSSTPVGVALVIDTSVAMKDGDKLKAVKDAAVRYVTARQAGEQVAIIAAGAPARVVTEFTTDQAKLTAAVNSLSASGAVARWDGIGLTTGLFTD